MGSVANQYVEGSRTTLKNAALRAILIFWLYPLFQGLRRLTRRQTERHAPGLDSSGQTVTVIKCQPKARIRFLNFNPEDHILVAETIETQTRYSFQNQLDDDVLREHIVSLLIHFFRHVPCVDAQRRTSLSIQVQADNLRVVKIRPISKPIVKFSRSRNFLDFDGPSHSFLVLPMQSSHFMLPEFKSRIGGRTGTPAPTEADHRLCVGCRV